MDLRHVNTKAAIPYVYSSLGYGFLWNMPSTGTVELGMNRTRWNSDCAKTMDYVVIAGSPREASEKLADLTGHAPEMPEYALGFWQCKLRYERQEQVLEVARKYKELGVPVSVIIIDYFHWTEQGDYKFFVSSLKGWSRGRNCRCLSNAAYLPPFYNQMNLRAALHTGHENFP